MTDLDHDAAARHLPRAALNARYTRVIRLIEAAVDELNAVRIAAGKASGTVIAGHGIASFGYIGNCGPAGQNDDRSWYVFLPADAGRERSLGSGFRTGDVDGAASTLAMIRAVVVGAKLMA